jgi:hypothetical protein
MQRLQPLFSSEVSHLTDLWPVCPDLGLAVVLVVRFCNWEKSLTGGVGLDGDKISMGAVDGAVMNSARELVGV